MKIYKSCDLAAFEGNFPKVSACMFSRVPWLKCSWMWSESLGSVLFLLGPHAPNWKHEFWDQERRNWMHS